MLRSAKEMERFFIKAIDGEIGKLLEFYFDDHIWIVRYKIVDFRKHYLMNYSRKQKGN